MMNSNRYEVLIENPRILVPTDLSELSMTAFASANYLIQILGGTIIPLHVYDTDKEVGSYPAMPAPQKSVEEVKKELESKVQTFVNEEYLEPVIVKKGRAWEVIMKESEKADLLVMTTHGRSGFSRLFLGSVTERVVRFSKAPVLLIEEESELKPLSEILLTTDFSDHSLQAFDYARSLVKKTNGHVHLVHLMSSQLYKKLTVFENQVALIQERLNNWVEEHLSDVQTHVTAEVLPVDSSVHEAIVYVTTRKKYNLVVMSTLGHSGLEYLRLGSTAANVLRLVNTAVLSINPKRSDAIVHDHAEW